MIISRILCVRLKTNPDALVPVTASGMNPPKVQISTTTVPALLSWVLLILHCGFVSVHYRELPSSIPIHFDASGVADSYGSRAMLWLLPAINTLLVVLLTVVSRYPHRMNYPVKLTPSNTQALYRLGASTMQALQLSVTLLFSLITWQSARVALGHIDGIGSWILPLVLLLIFLPLLLFIFRCYSLGSRT